MKSLQLNLDGTLTVENGDFFLQVDKALQKGVERIFIDLSSVTFIDSASIQLMATSLTLAQKQGAEVAIIALRPNVRAAFRRLAYLDPRLDFETLEDAQSQIKQAA